MSFAHHMAAASAYLSSQQGQPSQLQPILSSIAENPNSDTIPMVPPPLELVGSWKGSNCGLDDLEAVEAELVMADNGANVWFFADGEGDLEPQTGNGVEVIVGFQCVDVGRGYWWGQVPHSDVLWCNLFQVEDEEAASLEEEEDGTKLVRYTNLAYGGQGVGGLAEGSCPTSLAGSEEWLSSSSSSASTNGMNILQASFTRRLAATSSLQMTCNVPAGSDRVQPSHNSQFPRDAAVPNPFEAVVPPVKHGKALRNSSDNYGGEAHVGAPAPTTLPVLNEKSCRALVVAEKAEPPPESPDSERAVPESAAGKPGAPIVMVAVSFLSWAMMV